MKSLIKQLRDLVINFILEIANAFEENGEFDNARYYKNVARNLEADTNDK